MAATDRAVIYQGAFGSRDMSMSQAMTTDSVFWIASMTKAITSVAAMQLVEQGRLSLDGPVAKVLPELAETQVLEGFDAQGSPKLRSAKGPITLRQLMTHTAGFAYEGWNAELARYTEKTETPGPLTGERATLKAPAMSDPGTRWEYGTSTGFVGLAVEAVSGTRLDAYFRDNIFIPLGMTDTAFKISDAMRARLVGMHARGPDGALNPIPFEIEQEPEFHVGGGGLYGTAPNYLTFTRMILNKGRGNGQQVLKPETVELMSQNQIGELDMTMFKSFVPLYSNDLDVFPGIPKKWGLGFMINAAETPEGRSAGSLAWAGLANIYFWIDPSSGVAGVILMQLLPFLDHTSLETLATFERGIYGALGGSKHAA
jgi:methyl acetate hydrolase